MKIIKCIITVVIMLLLSGGYTAVCCKYFSSRLSPAHCAYPLRCSKFNTSLPETLGATRRCHWRRFPKFSFHGRFNLEPEIPTMKRPLTSGFWIMQAHVVSEQNFRLFQPKMNPRWLAKMSFCKWTFLCTCSRMTFIVVLRITEALELQGFRLIFCML